MHPFDVDHVRRDHRLLLVGHRRISLLSLRVGDLLLLRRLVGYVVQLLKMAFVMVFVAFLASTDVLAYCELVAPRCLHQHVARLLAELRLIGHHREALKIALFCHSLHLSYRLRILHEIRLI